MGGDRDGVNRRSRRKLHDLSTASFYIILFQFVFNQSNLSLRCLTLCKLFVTLNFCHQSTWLKWTSPSKSDPLLAVPSSIRRQNRIIQRCMSHRRRGVATFATVPAQNYLLTPRPINYFRQDARRGTAMVESFCLINARTISARQSVVRSCDHDVALFARLCQLQQRTLPRSLLPLRRKVPGRNKRYPLEGFPRRIC